MPNVEHQKCGSGAAPRKAEEARDRSSQDTGAGVPRKATGDKGPQVEGQLSATQPRRQRQKPNQWGGGRKSQDRWEESPKPRARRPEKGSPPVKRMGPETQSLESKPEGHPEPGPLGARQPKQWRGVKPGRALQKAKESSDQGRQGSWK